MFSRRWASSSLSRAFHFLFPTSRGGCWTCAWGTKGWTRAICFLPARRGRSGLSMSWYAKNPHFVIVIIDRYKDFAVFGKLTNISIIDSVIGL
jgi:hypothetical protein